jgi:hypothetical protein
LVDEESKKAQEEREKISFDMKRWERDQRKVIILSNPIARKN